MQYRPIVTHFGMLRGRDALEAVSLTLSGATLRLEAIVNLDGLYGFRLITSFIFANKLRSARNP